MYIYSLCALGLTAYLAPHVRKQSPLQCVALAWFYLLDSVINAVYTALFGVAWFWVLATRFSDESAKAPGSKTIEDTAGFTSPQLNVSKVEIVAEPAPGLQGQNAAAVGIHTGSQQPVGLSDALFKSGSMMSLSVIIGLWAVRVYFVFVVLAYARSCLRQHILMTSSSNFTLHTGSATDELAENPFNEGREEGHGWKGKLGRAMLSIGKDYWLGREGEEDVAEWMRGMGGKFSSKKDTHPLSTGVVERERRRRSGTGPPPPPPDLPRFETQV